MDAVNDFIDLASFLSDERSCFTSPYSWYLEIKIKFKFHSNKL